MIATMYDHRWKQIGVIISAVGLVMMIAERVTGLIVLQKLNAGQHYAIYEWIMLVGLVVVMYSKEKQDDERAKFIRAKAFQIAFMIMVSVMLSGALSFTISTKAPKVEASDLFFFSAAGIIIYLLIFHLGLYFDILIDYKDTTVADNFKLRVQETRWGILGYFIAAAITLILLSLL